MTYSIGLTKHTELIGCPEISLFRHTVKHSWVSIPFGLNTDHAKFQIDTPMAWFLELDLKKLTFEQNLLLFTDFPKRSPFETNVENKPFFVSHSNFYE